MGYLALLVILTGCLLAGWGWTARTLEPARSLGFRLALSAIAGWVALDVLLLSLDLAGIGWSRWSVGLPFAALTALLWWRRAKPAPPSSPQSWGLGDGVALGALLVFIVCTVWLWDVHSDFIYHWGVKAKKFFLAGGLDLDFLTRPWNAGHLHADYPNFLPALLAFTAIVTGEFQLVPILLWSAAFFAAILLAGREVLSTCAVSRHGMAAGMAVLGLTLTMFGVGYLQAGGADWLIALALMAGSVPLLGRPDAGADHEIGWIAALAAAAKIEGVVLAGLLIGSHWLRRWLDARGRGFSWRLFAAVLLRATLPCILVVGLWLIPIWRHDLHVPSTSGWDLSRAGVILRGLWQTLLTPNWHGLSFCLLVLPLFVANRQLWPVALVSLLQLSFYVAVYFTAATDPAHYVATSAARLFFHVVPTALLLGVVWLDRHAFPAKLSPPHGPRA